MGESGAVPAAPNPLEAWFRANQGRAVNKWPHYFPVYHRHLARYRGGDITVVEFGVQHGGSLQMWRDYFGPGSRVIGVDNDPRCAGITDAGVTVVIGDQEDRGFLARLAADLGPVDVVIDDGGHSMAQQLATFEVMWPALAEGGTFLTEDVHTSYRPDYGGGYRRAGTFAEHAKDMIDAINAWHSHDQALAPGYFTRTVAGMHVYDSVVVFDKGTHGRPEPPAVTGTASF
jgi:cephalosporin hydroxylase